VATSQSLIVLSPDPEARIFPSGEKATELTVRMPGEGAELLPCGHVPELDRFVIGPGGEDLPVRGEGHRATPPYARRGCGAPFLWPRPRA
jgi:hypothetical protein